MRKVEILAPAGSIEAMQAAINAGCDAVYIGGSKFGARAYANNLTQEQMLRAIDYVHVHDRQLYLTVNTLLKNDELKEELYDYLAPFYEHGLDAVIVQDVGAIKFIHEAFPKLPIHASTQMTLTTGQGVNCLKQYGVSRIVPARELSLTEIAQIRKETDLEIEAFVHGALCYCYSGQCLLSSMIGGRSGNRGRCAQPCRTEFKVGEKSSYVLSPKDMCTLTMVPDLVKAGIDSFKIEGRMKRPEYTAGVVLAYRKQLELFEELGEIKYREYHRKNPQIMEKELEKLQDLYNRGGFSTGYYKNHNGKKMMSMQRPNHSGVLVGKVTQKKGIQADIRLTADVNSQDILEFRKDGEQTYEFTVKEGKEKGKLLTTNTKPGSRISIGDEVYRTKNAALLEELSKDFVTIETKIPITGIFHAAVGEAASLTVTAMNTPLRAGTNQKEEAIPVSVTVTGDTVMEAVKQPMQKEDLYKKLNKTKESAFIFTDLSIFLNGSVFYPVGKLNELRREALSALYQKIAAQYRREKANGEPIVKKEFRKAGQEKRICVSVRTLAQCQAAASIDKVTEIYVDLSEVDIKDLPSFYEAAKGKELFLKFPAIFRNDFYNEFAKHKDILTDEKAAGYVLRNFESLSFVREALETKLPLIVDYNMYVMNDEAVSFYHDFDIHRFTASLELNRSELAALTTEEFDLIVYQTIPVMVSAQCVKKNTEQCRLTNKDAAWQEDTIEMVDRKQMKLFDRTNCRFCYNTIYQTQPYSLLGEQESIRELAIGGIRLDFLMETKEETREIIRKAISLLIEDGCKIKALDNVTTGHFKRGIL